MGILSHISYPALFFVLIARIFQIKYSFFDLLMLIFFSVLPDLDLLFFSFIKKKALKFSFFDLLGLTLFSIIPDFDFLFKRFAPKDNSCRTPLHHRWPTHWPISYLPLIFILCFYPNLKLFFVCLGLYSHLILDTFLGGGIMWLAPFSKKFFSLFAANFKNYRGREYFDAYKKTIFYKADIVALLILLIILLNFWL